MSAARTALRRWAYSVGFIESEFDGAADRMYALVGHELAEKIRAHTASDYAHVLSAYGYAYANGWKSGRDRAAALIEEVAPANESHEVAHSQEQS